MKETNEKQCPNPNCKSKNVIKTDHKGPGIPKSEDLKKSLHTATYPIWYQCKDCGNLFTDEEL